MFRFTDIIIFHVTRDCNLHCKYCFMKKILKQYPGEIIDYELYKKIIEQIIAQRKINHSKNALKLIFHGGEPLLVGKKLLYKMADYAVSRFKEESLELELGLQTNASLIDEEFAKIFNKFDIHIGLSFDGINSDESRDVKLDIFEQKFDLFKKYKVAFGVLLVLGRHNIDNLKDTIKYLEEKEIKGYKFSYVEDMFNPGENSKIELDGKTLFDKAFKILLERFLENGTLYEFYTQELLQRAILDIMFMNPPAFKTGCGGKICGSVISMIAVDPDGTVNYCDRWAEEYDEIYVMNALDYDFLGLYQIKRALDFTQIKHKALLQTGCDTCYADYICNHGCISFYYSKYGKWGIDKRIVCGLHKAFYSFVLENLESILLKMAEINYSFSIAKSSLTLKQNVRHVIRNLKIEFEIEDNELKIYKQM